MQACPPFSSPQKYLWNMLHIVDQSTYVSMSTHLKDILGAHSLTRNQSRKVRVVGILCLEAYLFRAALLLLGLSVKSTIQIPKSNKSIERITTYFPISHTERNHSYVHYRKWVSIDRQMFCFCGSISHMKPQSFMCGWSKNLRLIKSEIRYVYVYMVHMDRVGFILKIKVGNLLVFKFLVLAES